QPLDLALVLQPLREAGELICILDRRAARVGDAREQQLVDPLRQVGEVRQVEVDADSLDRQLRESVFECNAGVAERQLQCDGRAAAEALERPGELLHALGAYPSEEW